MLLNDVGPACAHAAVAAHYWLATTKPTKLIPGIPQLPKKATDPGKGTQPDGSSCQVMVTFAKFGEVPETAALIVDQPGTSSTVTLTVSRSVNLVSYLAIPAISGGVITLLAFVFSVLLIWRYDQKRRNPFPGLRNWLERPILGSGAWTVNDSWATNISTGLVVIAAILGATTATNSLFPGVALDRFSIVNIAAGFFVAAAPVLFGILYSWFTAANPGLMVDATIQLPSLRAATVSVLSGANITLAADTTIQDSAARWATVRAGGTYQIPPGATIQVLAGVQAVAQACTQAARQTVANLLGVAAANAVSGQASRQALRLAIEQAIADRVTQPGMQPDILDGEPTPDQLRNAVAAASGEDSVRVAAEGVVQDAAAAAGHPVPPEAMAECRQAIANALTLTAMQTDTAAVNGAMAYSGGADIGLLAGSTLQVTAPAGTWTIQPSDVLAPRLAHPVHVDPAALAPLGQNVQLVQLVPPAPTTPDDVPLEQPVLIEAAGGAKMTVTGAARIKLRKNTVISAQQRQFYLLPRNRTLLAPQGTNVIVANLGILLIVNILTMFGIGAELGIAAVLARYSDAAGSWRVVIFLVLAAIAALVISYAATATRAIADPQPGSSISSQVGASFTL